MPAFVLQFRRLLMGTFTALGLLVVVVTATPLVYWYGTVLAGPWNDPGGDILIVPGASTTSDPVIGLDSYWRAVSAVYAHGQGPFKKVVMSGAGIARGMRTFLIASGVSESVVVTEDRATSTRENALYVAQMLRNETGRKVLLTSDFHMFRAYRAFRKAGLDMAPRPFPDARKRASGWRGSWPVFQDEVIETAKIGYYYLRGWI